jgi:hypothetical protein
MSDVRIAEILIGKNTFVSIKSRNCIAVVVVVVVVVPNPKKLST